MPLFADNFTLGYITLTLTILELLRIKNFSALRYYTFSSPYAFHQFVTFHNFVTEKILMTLPYRRIYVKKKNNSSVAT
jgi:hypothetical protein